MNASELAAKMLEWEQKKEELIVIEDEIKASVMAMEKTQTVGNVRASYSKGKGKTDYAKAWDHSGVRIPYEDFESYQTISTDWKALCVDQEIPTDNHYTPGKPYVTVTLLT